MVEQKEKYKIIAMAILLGICFLTYYVYIVMGVTKIQSSFLT